MILTRTDAVAVALVLVSLASAAGAVTAPARAAAAGEQAVAEMDAAVIERDQAVQSAEGDYGQAVAVADVAHGRAVAAARGDRESEYQAAVRDRDAAVADLGKIADPSRESVRERGDKYAQRCADVSSANPIKNAPPSPIKVDVTWAWMMAEVDPADEGRCREAGDERIAADLAKAKQDVAARRKALVAVRDENARTVAAIDKAAGPAVKQAGQARGQAVAQAQATRDAAVQAAEAQAAPVIAAAEEDMAAAEESQTGTVIALWLAAVVAAAGAVWFGRRRLAQVPVRRAGGALTAVAVWLVQGWAKAAVWAMQQRRGSRFKRGFEDSAHAGLQAGAFSSAEVLKGNEMAHRWDTSKPQRAVSRTKVALIVMVLPMAGMAVAQHFGANVPDTLGESGLRGFRYFLSHLVPLSWVVFGGPIAAAAVAGIGHALPLDAPMPPPAAPGSAPAAGPAGLAAFDSDTAALAAALGDKYATAVAEGTVPAAASVRHDNGRVIEARLPAGMVASQFRKTGAEERFAAALFIPQKRVRLMPSDTPAVLRVEVLDVNPEDLPAEGFPLLEGATFDFNKPVPVGLTSERERVDVTFHAHAALFAGQRGSGKTTAMRNVAAAAAIDPNVRLFVVDMKGEDDWSMFAGRADMFVCDTDPRRAERVIDAAVAERQKRSELKRANPGMKFPTLLLVIDEFQSLSDSAMVKLEALIKKSRSTAVDVVLGTQAPTKRAGVAVDMLEQIDVRWLGKVESDTMADKVFPRGFREEGVDVSKTRMGRGRAWVVADGEYRLVQTYSTTADDITAMVRRGPQREPAPADYDAAREAAEAEPGCKRCGGPVPAGKTNGFCSDACRKAFTRALKEGMIRA